jgi:hypothetical protein
MTRELNTQSAGDDRPRGTDGKWMAPREFVELAISNRRLLRCDQPADGVRGLHDPETGERYWIKQEYLMSST